MKTHLRLELKKIVENIESFKNRFKREYYISKLAEIDNSRDMGEVESRKYLAQKMALEIMQLIKDVCLSENIEFDTVRTTTALNLNEDECIKNFMTYVERLFYIDINLHDTLMLLYSTLVSYINYNDLIYDDMEKMCIYTEDEEGSYYKGKLLYKLPPVVGKK